MTVQVHDWHDAPRDVRELWRALIAEGRYNPSLHPDWLEVSLASWGIERGAKIAVVRADGDTLAVIPFIVRTRRLYGMPLRCLEPCSNVMSYHAEIVCRGDTTTALAAFLADRSLPHWDAFCLTNVPAQSRTAAAVRALTPSLGSSLSVRQGERSPYVVIDRDWPAYLTARPKKVRANISRSQRLLREAGESGMTWFEHGADTTRLLAEMLEIEAQSWKAKAGVAIVANTPQHVYYQKLLPWLSQHGMMANVLYVKERPVAYALCAISNGWIGQLKTSYAEGLGDAGSRVIQTSLERGFARGQGEYDFLGDAAPHKLRWTEVVRPHEDLWMFGRHLRARLAGTLKTVADRIYERRARAEAAQADAD